MHEMNIVANIKQIRELKNFTQEYMAHEIGISQASYSRLENEKFITLQSGKKLRASH